MKSNTPSVGSCRDSLQTPHLSPLARNPPTCIGQLSAAVERSKEASSVALDSRVQVPFSSWPQQGGARDDADSQKWRQCRPHLRGAPRKRVRCRWTIVMYRD